MGKEKKNYLLTFEGLSCCGKSSLIKELSSAYGCIPIVRRIPRDLPSPTPEIFIENDEAKFAAARDCPGIALMDRGYLSTLVFYTVMEEIKPGFSADKVRHWVAESIGETILKPNYYIFIDVPPEVSRARAKAEGRPFDERNLWMTHTERMFFWYMKYFKTLEGDVPLIKLDGTMSLASLQEELKRFIDKLKAG